MPVDDILRVARERGNDVLKFVQTYHGPGYRAACRATFDPDERAAWVHAALRDVLVGAIEGRFSGLQGDDLYNAIRIHMVCLLLERYRERMSGERFGETPLAALTLARHVRLVGADPLDEAESRKVVERLKGDQLLAGDLRLLLSLDRAFRTGRLTPYESEAEEESRLAFSALLDDDSAADLRHGAPSDAASTRASSPRSLSRGPARLLETVRRWLLPPVD